MIMGFIKAEFLLSFFTPIYIITNASTYLIHLILIVIYYEEK